MLRSMPSSFSKTMHQVYVQVSVHSFSQVYVSVNVQIYKRGYSLHT
jgi:hypothetical protein